MELAPRNLLPEAALCLALLDAPALSTPMVIVLRHQGVGANWALEQSGLASAGGQGYNECNRCALRVWRVRQDCCDPANPTHGL